MANNDKENKIKKFTKEAIGKTLNQFNKEIGITDLVEINKNQDRILNGILSQVNDENTEKTEKSNIITLDNSTDGIVELKEIQGDTNVNVSKIEEMPITHDIGDKEGNVFTLNEIPKGAISIGEIQGNTMVNCNKDDKKELVLMKDLSTEGYSNITLTEGVDGGLVDIALEGNTMVNVCDQKDPVAITKSYTVETGNHVALQGEYDGKCRPVVTGNTLVNLNITPNTITTISSPTGGTMQMRRAIYNFVYALTKGKDYTLFFNISNLTKVGNNSLFLSLNGGRLETTRVTPVEGLNIVKLNDTNETYDLDSLWVYFMPGTQESADISDVIILEGDYTDKPIPDYFEGLQSSFEDKVVPENLAGVATSGENITTNDTSYILGTSGGTYSVINIPLNKNLKVGETYTVYFKGIEKVGKPNIACALYNYGVGNASQAKTIDKNLLTFTVDSATTHLRIVEVVSESTSVTLDKNIYVLEGDYTNYDFSDYDPTKAGKYKVDYVVTGKNKFDVNSSATLGYYLSSNLTVQSGVNNVLFNDYIKVNPNTTYTITIPNENVARIIGYDSNKNPIKILINYTYTGSVQYNQFTTDNNISYIRLSFNGVMNGIYNNINIQLEEGTEATTYEPYKEYKKTFYLNSPLLEGDTIEQQGDNVVHVHRYGKYTITDNEPWNIQQPGNYNTYYCYIPGIISNIESKPILNILCNKIKPLGTMDRSQENIYVAYNNQIVYTPLASEPVTTAWLQNKTAGCTIIYPLATPQYEVISQNDTILCDSYVNGHLDVDSVVPIKKVVFKGWKNNLKYLYPNTNYVLQFESDNIGILSFNLGSTLLNQSIVKGINKFNITTPSNMANTDMFFTGIGFNASNIVVTEATDQEFGYFEGMKSVGECEGNKIEILSRNKNLIDTEISNWTLGKCVEINTGKIYIDRNRALYDKYIPVTPGSKLMYTGYIDNNGNSNINGVCILQYDFNKKYLGYAWGSYNPTLSAKCRYIKIWVDNSAQWNQLEKICSQAQLEEGNISTERVPHAHNTQTLTHEPLRSVGDVKDKYVLIDGKWYIERNCGEVVLDGSEDENWKLNGNQFIIKSLDDIKYMYNPPIICDKVNVVPYQTLDDETGYGINATFYIRLNLPNIDANNGGTVEQIKTYLQQNPTTVVYQLQTPQYEPIDYNPFTVYSDVTHISNNSTIPCNMTIKNTGFNCLLKPSTTYTVSSNLGLNTVTTPSTLTEDCLRFYDTDTSTVTTMKDVLILEGDWTTKADLIPCNFSGIESAFEQELVTDENDEHFGKYKVTARVIGKNLFGGLNFDNEQTNGYKWYKINNLEKNVQYTFTTNKNTTTLMLSETNYYSNGNYIVLNNKNFTGNGKKTFINPYNKNSCYVGIYKDELNNYNFQLEQGNIATAYEPYKESNVTFYVDEPLRGTGTAKDKVYVKDDKVVVERNCGSVTFDGSDDEVIEPIYGSIYNKKCLYSIKISKLGVQGNNLKSNTINTTEGSTEYYNPGIYLFNDNIRFILNSNILNNIYTVSAFKQWLQQNPTTVVYQLAEPTYEEVEYSSNRLILNTFNNESFNNSTLFLDTNISPKLSFKPLWEELVYVKNSTKYYIQFNAVGSGEVVINLGGTEITTEIVEGYNCISITTPSESTNLMTISGQGITISEVVVSEVVCGGYYKGLQSCFEEHMENGKYRVLLRGIALDGSKVNGIKLYINEPLRGVEGVKDRLCIKNGKLMIERKCGEFVLDERATWSGLSTNVTPNNPRRYTTYFKNINANFSPVSCPIITDRWETINNDTDVPHVRFSFSSSLGHGILWVYDPIVRYETELRQYLKQNPITVVYQLAEPTYEEATNEYGLPIVFEGYENGIVYIDSSITPTTHIKYTSNNQLATTLAEAEEQNISTQEDINMNVITYMMDIDMMLTDMEMSNDVSVMAVRRDSSNENMLDRMSDEDKKVYRDNTVVMLEKMITANVLEKEDIEGRINMYYNKNRISKEQYKYLKSLL